MQTRRERGGREATSELVEDFRRATFRAAERQRSAGSLEREVVAAERKACRHFAERLVALFGHRMPFGVFHRPLRGELGEVLSDGRLARSAAKRSCAR